jgi:hypothetical protein
MIIYNELLKNLNGVINVDTLMMRYYKPLPAELAKWYVYTLDGGHNIFVLLKQFENELKDDPNNSYADFIIPCPVITVLRGYTVNDDGIIVVEGLQYSYETGLIPPEDDNEYSIEGKVRESEKMNLISIQFAGKDVIETDFFNSSYNLEGLFYMAYNEKCFQLLIPSLHLDKINEMKTGKYAVITIGKDRLIGKEMIEIMFEDFTDSPYSIHISQEQMPVRIGGNFNKLKFELRGYCETGKVFEMDVYVRSGIPYQLPFLKPIDTNLFAVA